jgi:hypothetical protein
MQSVKIREVLFKVVVREHEYVMYTNGQIEGFGEGAVVVNYYPLLAASLYVHASGANGIASAPSCPTSKCNEDLVGATHATAE